MSVAEMPGCIFWFFLLTVRSNPLPAGPVSGLFKRSKRGHRHHLAPANDPLVRNRSPIAIAATNDESKHLGMLLYVDRDGRDGPGDFA